MVDVDIYVAVASGGWGADVKKKGKRGRDIYDSHASPPRPLCIFFIAHSSHHQNSAWAHLILQLLGCFSISATLVSLGLLSYTDTHSLLCLLASSLSLSLSLSLLPHRFCFLPSPHSHLRLTLPIPSSLHDYHGYPFSVKEGDPSASLKPKCVCGKNDKQPSTCTFHGKKPISTPLPSPSYPSKSNHRRTRTTKRCPTPYIPHLTNTLIKKRRNTKRGNAA